MKKSLALFIAGIMCFGVVSCRIEDEFGRRHQYFLRNETSFFVVVEARWFSMGSSDVPNSRVYEVEPGGLLQFNKDQFNACGPFDNPSCEPEMDSLKAIIRFSSKPPKCVYFSKGVKDYRKDIRQIRAFVSTERDCHVYTLSHKDWMEAGACLESLNK